MVFITLADFDSRWGAPGKEQNDGRGGGSNPFNQTLVGRRNVYLGGTLLNVLGLGDGAGGGEGRGGNK